jgi:hypothetical protein
MLRELWIERPLKNWLIFVKTREIGGDRFHWFSENWLVKFDFFQKFEIKISKKTKSI